VSGMRILHDPIINKGTAFSERERERLSLEGLLPPRIESLEEQVVRVVAGLQSKSSDLDKYTDLAALQNENETLFFRTLIDNLETLLPIVYTPTVGQACLQWSRIYQQPRGLYLTRHHRGRIRDLLHHWPYQRLGVIVVTDGGRILGLGDLGANGMGIPIGKLVLYVACAGVDPALCLPVMLDVGTDTDAVRSDAAYLGVREHRLSGPPYEELLEEFITAAHVVFPSALIQFEDFSTVNAFKLLARYRDRFCCFNDDIQGTAAMGLAGLYSAARLTGKALAEQRVLFFGAGAANIGIAALLVRALMQEGLGESEAHRRCWFMDSKGLVTHHRTELAEHKRAFVQPCEPIDNLLAAVQTIRPHVLIGASGQANAFTEPVLAAMARINERPVVFALSNPTSKAECTAEQAYRATEGRVIFASGSPLAPVTLNGRIFVTGQANNAHVFPGIGLGVLVSHAARVTDAMFLAAARTLAHAVSSEDLVRGRIFPETSRMREVAAGVAGAVADVAYADGLAGRARPADLAHIQASMYRGEYK